MKFQYILLCIFLVASSASNAERPENLPDSSKFEWPVASEFVGYGIKLGMSYENAEAIMKKHGWVVEIDKNIPSNNKPFIPYPEIICGEGFDATCSATFAKAGRLANLDIRQSKGALVIRGSSE